MSGVDARAASRGPVALAILWVALMVLAFSLPTEGQVRGTVRVALLFALPACLLFPWLPWGERLARWCWSLAWLAYLAHVAVTFHLKYGWSHAEAVAHVQRRSGFGPGIWFSHLFTLLVTLDVAWWWMSPVSWRRRPRWVTWTIWGYLGFITFNATVVYETGFIQVGGLILSVLILGSGTARLILGGGSSSISPVAALPDNSPNGGIRRG